MHNRDPEFRLLSLMGLVWGWGWGWYVKFLIYYVAMEEGPTKVVPMSWQCLQVANRRVRIFRMPSIR